MQPFSFDNQNYTPLFSPDGSQIVLTREVNDSKQDLWIMRADAPGSMRLLRRMETLFNSSLSFAPDGRGLLMRTQGTDTRQDLIFVSWGDGDSVRVRSILSTRFNEPVGAISPDGRWLAYVSDESGHYECSVRAFPSAEGQVAVVSRGASADPTASNRIGLPVWRRDGRELLYVAADGHTLMVVTVTPGAPPSFGEPHPLFRLQNSVADMAVSPGLDRFVLSITREEEGRSAATILLHWPQLLENTK
jgi:Tol biopolymer transport system component